MGMPDSGSVQSALLDPPLRCGLTSVQPGYSLVCRSCGDSLNSEQERDSFQ